MLSFDPRNAQVSCETDADCPAEYACAAGACVRSAAPTIGEVSIDRTVGGTQRGFNVAFAVSEPLGAPPEVTFTQGRFSVEESAALHYIARYVPSGSEAEGTYLLNVRVIDSEGNETRQPLGVSITLDFTPPTVLQVPAAVAPALTLIPADTNPLRQVTSVTTGTRALLSFFTDELVEAPVVSGFTQQSGAAASFIYKLDEVPEGEHAITIDLVDLAGNPSHVQLDGKVTVDRTPPPAPPDGIVFERTPWGSLADPRATAHLQAPLSDDTWVVYADADGNGEIMRSHGGRFELPTSDRPRVWIAALDGAGNRGPVVEVRDVLWTATMIGKVSGSTLENPHELSATARFDPVALLTADLLAPSDVAPLAASDGSTVQTRGGGRWSEWTLGGDPPLVAAGAAYDVARGHLLRFGGEADNVIVPDLPSDETWQRSGVTWRKLTPVDFESDGNPAAGPAFAYYDDSEGRVYVIDNTLALWSWTGGSWARHSTQTPQPRALAYDSVRRVPVLFANNGVFEWRDRAWIETCVDAACAASRPAEPGTWVATFDRQRGVIVLASSPATGCIALRTYDGVAFSDLATDCVQAPSARPQFVFAYDETSRRLILHGAVPVTSFVALPKFTDTWAYGPTGWRCISDPGGCNLANAPAVPGQPALIRPLLAFDQRRNALVLGESPTWELRGDTWVLFDNTVVPRSSVGAALGTLGGDGVLFGGFAVSGANETWRFHDGLWSRACAGGGCGAPTGLTQVRMSGSLLWDEGDLWRWGGASWTRLCDGGSCAGPTPAADAAFCSSADNEALFYQNAVTTRWTGAAYAAAGTGAIGFVDARMARDPRTGETVLFGGQNCTGANDKHATYVYDGTRWRVASAGGPSARTRHAMATDERRGEALMFGGLDDEGGCIGDYHGHCDGDIAVCGTLWAWAGTGWVQPLVVNSFGDGMPARRQHAAMTGMGPSGDVLLFGGVGTPDTWTWDGGASSSPAHVLAIDFSAARAEGEIQSIAFSWDADGTGGAAFWLWDGRRFRPLNGDGEWSSIDEVGLPPLANLLVGGKLYFAATSRLPNGQLRDRAEVRSDAVEVRVRYKRP